MNQNLSNRVEKLVDISTNLEQSGSLFDSDINVVVRDFHLKNDSNNKFDREESCQANGSNLSENQECEQVSQFGDFIADNSRLKDCFCSKTLFNLSKKVLDEREIKVLEKEL